MAAGISVLAALFFLFLGLQAPVFLGGLLGGVAFGLFLPIEQRKSARAPHIAIWFLISVVVFQFGIGLSGFVDDPPEGFGRLVILALLGIVFAQIVGFWIFKNVLGLDLPTAWFTSSTAGVMENIFLAKSNGGDENLVGQIQFVRLFTIMAVIPVLYTYLFGLVGGDERVPVGSLSALFGLDLGLGLILAPIFMAMSILFPIPGSRLGTPLIAGILVGYVGVISSPNLAGSLIVAQLVLGVNIGLGFASTPFKELVRIIIWTICFAAILLLFSFLAAYTLSPWTGVAPEIAFLAIVPGGVAELAAIAAMVNEDYALVLTVQIARLALAILLLPTVFRLLRSNTM